jgi:photosystem II stability/assembly factor-like uncharacterized protein
MKFFTGLFVLSVLVLSGSVYGQGGWNDVTPSDTYPGILGVYALDADNVWVVGQEGTILNTTNSGTSWSEINCPVTYSLYNVEFISADTGWVGGDDDSDTEVMRTTDRGLSWDIQTVDNNPDGNYDMKFIKGSSGESPRGFVTAGLSHVWRTDNYGETWLQSPIGGCGAGDLQSICFIDKNEGWFVGTPASGFEVTIVHTTDGGETFDVQTNPTDPDRKLNCVSFADNQHGLAVGDGTILSTSDGGQNWEECTFNFNLWWSVYLSQSGRAWAVGHNGSIAYSTDWGYTWTAQESGVTCELWEVFFINDNEGWIVGGGIGKPGVILHTTTGGVVTGVKEDNIIRKFELYQNYPNPFNPTTNIRYQIPERSFVTLKIFDVLGNEITTLVNEEKEAGRYESILNAEGLGSGVYYYQIISGSYIQTRKMIFIK